MVVVTAVAENKPQQTVVAEGKKLADAFGEELHVLNVLSLSDFVDLETKSVQRTGEPKSMDEVRDRAESFAHDAASTVTDDYTAVGRVGEPGAQIVEYARERDASYIVVGVRKRSPTGKAIFGSVPQSVFLSADRPVLGVLDRK